VAMSLLGTLGIPSMVYWNEGEKTRKKGRARKHGMKEAM